MNRATATYTIPEGQLENFKKRMLNWSQEFSILLFLDSNGHNDKNSNYECLLACGVDDIVPVSDDLSALSSYSAAKEDWLFGHIGYDYKNALEPRLPFPQHDNTGFDNIFFFRPKVVCYIKTGSNELIIESLTDTPDNIYDKIKSSSVNIPDKLPDVSFEKRTSRETYLDVVNKLREHIRNGDCYEINYCNECYAENVKLTPLNAFAVLNKLSAPPFAVYYRNHDKYMMCASPERYLQKKGSKVISQPIKGTARRDKDNQTDSLIKKQLFNSVKDRAENVMITDLVRNDLARSCITGSITVEELYGIHSFPQVHQMISTVTGIVDEQKPFSDTIKYSFPMGSMTGAPKIKVMELIDHYEDTHRNLFSGSVGYITPDGDFDFNVIIRSLFYAANGKRLSYQAGGAITYDSSAEAEWDEMRLKAWALEKIFDNSSNSH